MDRYILFPLLYNLYYSKMSLTLQTYLFNCVLKNENYPSESYSVMDIKTLTSTLTSLIFVILTTNA